MKHIKTNIKFYLYITDSNKQGSGEMRKKRRKESYGKHGLTKGIPVKMEGILLEQNFVYIPEKYIGQ